jgi:hypothetical protein
VVATCDSGFKLNIEKDMYQYMPPNPPDVVMSVVLNCDPELCEYDEPEITVVANTEVDGYKGTTYELFGTHIDTNDRSDFAYVSFFNGTKLTCDIIEHFCPELSAPANGMAEMTDGRKIGSKAHSQCNDGYEVVGNNEITCGASSENNGEWSSKTLPGCSVDHQEETTETKKPKITAGPSAKKHWQIAVGVLAVVVVIILLGILWRFILNKKAKKKAPRGNIEADKGKGTPVIVTGV